MLVLFWFLLLLVATCLILLMPAIWAKQSFDTYRGNRAVACPETHSPVVVRFHAFRAAIASLTGKPALRLADCSRWPVHADCDQACIPDALKAAPISEVLAAVPPENRVAYLPMLVAAFAAWVFGAAWHSQFVFRPRWTAAMNLSNNDTLALAKMWIPHLLTAAVCLVFAYLVASIMAWMGKRTLFRGVGIALMAWVVTALVVSAIGGLEANRDLLWIEGGYSFLGALIVGALAGGLPRRVLIRDNT